MYSLSEISPLQLGSYRLKSDKDCSEVVDIYKREFLCIKKISGHFLNFASFKATPLPIGNSDTILVEKLKK